MYNKLIKNKLKDLKKITKKHFKIKLKCKVKKDLKSIRILGTFQIVNNKNIINLNPELINEFKETYIDEVLTHEYAHMVVFHVYGRVQSHGKEFKEVSKILGIKGRAKTDIFSQSKVLNKNKIQYKCKCKSHFLTRYRHKQIENKKIKIYCEKCKSKLKVDKWH